MDFTGKIPPVTGSLVEGMLPANQTTVAQSTQPANSSGENQNFSQVLDKAQQTTTATTGAALPPTNRWRSLGFLATAQTPRIKWPWTNSNFNQTIDTTLTNTSSPLTGLVVPQPIQTIQSTQPIAYTRPIETSAIAATPFTTGEPMALADYPRPTGDNGCGIHWIPTISQSAEVVDKYVQEAVEMGMKWVVFLNEGTNIGANDYLVKKLTEAGIEPVMRVYTPGVVPVEGDLTATVAHYKSLGVNYFQLYNEPNLRVETGGQPADVDQYVQLWSDAAEQVIEGGGLPGFGALSPQGEMDDRDFLRQSLQKLQQLGKSDLLDRGWLSMHNYTGPRPLDDPDGFLRFRQYDTIIKDVMGRQLPIIGTEGGTHVTQHVSSEQQIDMVTGAYKYMSQREPYNFAYTYWIIANGHDSAWDEHALFKPEGPTPLVQSLKDMATGGNV